MRGPISKRLWGQIGAACFATEKNRTVRRLLLTGHFIMSRALSVLFLAMGVCAWGCVKAQPPTDTGDLVITTPLAPSAPTNVPSNPAPPATSDSSALAYDPDMKQLFASDCVLCHGPSRADGNYRMSTYAQVMTAVRAGNASSDLIQITQPTGRMYRYFSGSTATRQAKASQIRSWIVTYKAQETR
jgi:mono/diheme cytochrome c family protein